MKQIISTIALFTLFSTLLFADVKVPRSLEAILNGDALLDQSTTVSLGEGVVDFQGNLRKDITLTSVHSSPENGRSTIDSVLRKSDYGTAHKRSVYELTKAEIDQLPRDLKVLVYAAVKEKHAEITTPEWNQAKAKLLSETEFVEKGFENYKVLANFAHHKNAESKQSFYVLVIPNDALVEKTIFQIEWFGNGAGAHNQIRMIFDQPFVAIPQDPEADAYSLQVVQNDSKKADIVYSLQTPRLEGGGTEWSVFEGAMGEYANTIQLYSIQAKAKRQVYQSVIKQYELTNLSQPQKQAIFEAGLVNAQQLGDTTIYNTVLNSCITHALIALRGLPTEDGTSFQGAAKVNPLWFNPYSVFERLTSEADLQTNYLGTLNSEFEHYNEYAPAGEKVLSEADRMETEAYKKIAPFEKTLLQTNAFDDFVRKLAILIVDKKITAKQANGAIEKAQKVLAEGGSFAESGKLSPEAKQILSAITSEWVKTQPLVITELASKGITVPADSFSINDVLTVLGGIKTQENGGL